MIKDVDYAKTFKELLKYKMLYAGQKSQNKVVGKWLEAHRRLSRERGWDEHQDLDRLLCILDEIDAEESGE